MTTKSYLQVLQLVSVKVSRNIDSLRTDDNDLLSIEDSLGNDWGQSAQKVTAAVNYYWLKGNIENMKKKRTVCYFYEALLNLTIFITTLGSSWRSYT